MQRCRQLLHSRTRVRLLRSRSALSSPEGEARAAAGVHFLAGRASRAVRQDHYCPSQLRLASSQRASPVQGMQFREQCTHRRRRRYRHHRHHRRRHHHRQCRPLPYSHKHSPRRIRNHLPHHPLCLARPAHHTQHSQHCCKNSASRRVLCRLDPRPRPASRRHARHRRDLRNWHPRRRQFDLGRSGPRVPCIARELAAACAHPQSSHSLPGGPVLGSDGFL
mmetsp:Transcript_51295/g.109617  ORF Transcript_51295/g.109617 Transcript_51295/m.109617 type:complete len:221 (-) Transcript_51295:279-941(-)